MADYRKVRVGLALLALVLSFASPLSAAQGGTRRPATFRQIVQDVQPKIVKIHGAGGIRGLEPYQSGFLISADGHVLTVWSYVLDTDFITVTLDDGRRFEGKLVGADPKTEIAILKLEATDLAHFELATSATADAGARVLAFSNLFGVASGEEPASVQHGSVAVKTKLDARRGANETAFRGQVYVLDAMTNNPGAAGGALTNQAGQLLGMLGKEVRSTLTNTWLNYAVPSIELQPVVDDILAGKSRPRNEPGSEKPPANAANLALLGIELVPDVLERTPPFIDRVRTGTPAAAAGLKPDDLIVFVGERLVQSCKSLSQELAEIDREETVKLVLMRGQELITVDLKPGLVEPAKPEVPKTDAPKSDESKPTDAKNSNSTSADAKSTEQS